MTTNARNLQRRAHVVFAMAYTESASQKVTAQHFDGFVIVCIVFCCN